MHLSGPDVWEVPSEPAEACEVKQAMDIKDVVSLARGVIAG